MQNKQKLDLSVYQEMAGRMTSSQAVINKLIKNRLGIEEFTTRRIVEGVGNEVYQINTPGKEKFILRIHHGEHPGFTHEQWAMEEVNKLGVPTPSVLALGTTEENGKILSFSIQSFLAGESLSSLLDDGLNSDERKYYAHQAGAMLARIHSVRTEGYGHFTTEPGRGPSSTLVDEMEQHSDYDTLCAATADTEITPPELDAILATIDEINTDEQPHLVHVDYAPKHIFVLDREIVGIIDWEICMSGLAATDFNRWRAQDDRISMNELVLGYETVKSLPHDFWSNLRTIQIHSALRTILYHHKVTKSTVDRQKAASEAKSLLHSDEPIGV